MCNRSVSFSCDLSFFSRARAASELTRPEFQPPPPPPPLAYTRGGRWRLSLSEWYLSQSRSQSILSLDQRSENESSGSIHFEITKTNNRILVTWFPAQSQSASMACYAACLKWLLPELSFSDRWSRERKLRERDWGQASMRSCLCCAGQWTSLTPTTQTTTANLKFKMAAKRLWFDFKYLFMRELSVVISRLTRRPLWRWQKRWKLQGSLR